MLYTSRSTDLEQGMSVVSLADPELELRYRQVPVGGTEAQQTPVYRMTVDQDFDLRPADRDSELVPRIVG